MATGEQLIIASMLLAAVLLLAGIWPGDVGDDGWGDD